MTDSLRFTDWLDMCIQGIAEGRSHDQIPWPDPTASDSMIKSSLFSLFEPHSSPSSKSAPAIKSRLMQKAFHQFVQTALYHSSHEKWALLYDFTLDYLDDPRVLKNPLHREGRRIREMNKQVGRDIHKMRAFVRFQEIVNQNITLYSAFYESDHLTLKANGPFFKDRFSTMNWIVTTPYARMAWNGANLLYQPGTYTNDLALEDPVENLWKSYFSSTFNPGRLKIKAMKNEMPTRFWKNLPEAELIPDMIRSASQRVEVMKADGLKNRLAASSYIGGSETLEQLKKCLPACQACPLADLDSTPLLGEGFTTSPLMIVGEAPGDQEEKLGAPFVGPAGQLLKSVLHEIGIDSKDVYFTNAVKHFGFRKKGQQRVHKSPSGSQIMACRSWLQKEIEIVQPLAILGLGRSAVHSLLGFPMDLSTARSSQHRLNGNQTAFFSIHPASILRAPGETERNRQRESLLSDLRAAWNFVCAQKTSSQNETRG